jgi:sorbitol-specific phosphotransferase system component IIC
MLGRTAKHSVNKILQKKLSPLMKDPIVKIAHEINALMTHVLSNEYSTQ